jgi:DnaJ like chaperone protein
MRQAYEILGLQPGRKTLAEARTAFRARMAEYHPDKVAHLGVELRELAARKTVEINLAMEFVNVRLKRHDSL